MRKDLLKLKQLAEGEKRISRYDFKALIYKLKEELTEKSNVMVFTSVCKAQALTFYKMSEQKEDPYAFLYKIWETSSPEEWKLVQCVYCLYYYFKREEKEIPS